MIYTRFLSGSQDEVQSSYSEQEIARFICCSLLVLRSCACSDVLALICMTPDRVQGTEAWRKSAHTPVP